MILQSLYSLYDRIKDDPDYQVAKPNYSYQKISFKVVLNKDGTLFKIQDIRDYEGKRALAKPVLVLGYSKPSGSGLNPRFLWDNGGYMLGYKAVDHSLSQAEKNKTMERSKETFQAFRDMHLSLENKINCDEYSFVCRFLESWEPEQAEEYSVLDAVSTGFGVFQIIGETNYVHDHPKIREWWERYNAQKDSNAVRGECLLTQEYTDIAKLQPKIKGVCSNDAPLVGFNAAAYESYGKKQAYNAPVGEEAAFAYTSALNALTNGPMRSKHRFRLSDTTVVFWTDKPTLIEDIFADIAEQGSFAENEVQDTGLRERINLFFKALRTGREEYGDLEKDPDTTRFYILGMSPNAARIAVRFFYQSSVTELLDNLRAHFSDIQMQRQFLKNSNRPDPEFPSLFDLLRQTAREAKDISPILSGPLLRAVIAKEQYPQGLYSAGIRRIKADKYINYYRCCIIKGYLIRNLNQEVSMSLDAQNTSTAYRAGRLFAALEKTQKDALPDIKSTLRDRFYSSASATPRSVFPRLLRTYQHHLSKLDPGAKVNREKLIQEILAPVNDFPGHFNLADQGLFALGYYHQTQSFYEKKENEQE